MPFCDMIESGRTPAIERNIAPHPSLKPQEFLRKLVRAALPTGEGVILDPFAGSGSTLAAAHHLGLECIGIEKDAEFYATAVEAIPKLAALYCARQSINRQKASTVESGAERQVLIDIFAVQA